MCEALVVSQVAERALVLRIQIGILEICLGCCCLGVLCFILLRVGIDRQTPCNRELKLISNWCDRHSFSCNVIASQLNII